jgi:hypothetical protein
VSIGTAIVIIVAIIVIGGVMRSRYSAQQGHATDYHGNSVGSTQRERELEAELAELRERVHVLERIATEETETKRLSAEIDKLRDG